MEWLLSPKKYIKVRRRRRPPSNSRGLLASSYSRSAAFQGNKMVFAGIKKKDERANLIAYLQVRRHPPRSASAPRTRLILRSSPPPLVLRSSP